MRRKRVIVRFRAGPTWREGPPQAQPDWDAHEAFVDEVVERGPFSDHTGAMLLLEGVSPEEARRFVDLDPFLKNEVFVLDDIREWTIFVTV